VGLEGGGREIDDGIDEAGGWEEDLVCIVCFIGEVVWVMREAISVVLDTGNVFDSEIEPTQIF
jgi:hypothetical protein